MTVRSSDSSSMIGIAFFVLFLGGIVCYAVYDGITVTNPYFVKLRASENENFRVNLSCASPMKYFVYNGMVNDSGVIGLLDNDPIPDILNTLYVKVGSVFFRGSSQYQVIELTPDYAIFRRVDA